MTSLEGRFTYAVYIRSTPQKVFDALTVPELTRQYWGYENVSDWRKGSGWQHVRVKGQRSVELAGEVIENRMPKRLVLSWANVSDANDPASASTVTLEVIAYDEMALLTLNHDSLVAGSRMDAAIRQGWPAVLSSLKSFLETGNGLDIFATPKAA